MSIAVPLYGFGTGGNNQVLINVVGGLTQPENPKYGTIWIRTSTPINVWEVFPVTPVWDAGEGHVYIQNVPATDGNPPNFTALDYSRKPYGAIWLRLSGAMQRVNGAWVRQDAWVWRDNWIHFSSPRNTPEFTYTGDYAIVDDNDNAISDFATWTGNWKIRFLTSGTLTFTNLNGAGNGIDVFLVGGGGAGGLGWNSAGAGGGGGYTKTVKAVTVTANVAYPIVVGAGGTVTSTAKSGDGGITSAFGSSASGGSGGGGIDRNGDILDGGNGGSGGANYRVTNGAGTDGSNANPGGTGQGTTTKEFGESSGRLYSGGGQGGANTGSSSPVNPPVDETAGAAGVTPPVNRGGGGGGSNHANINNATPGGSGIVIIRNARG